MKKLLLLVAIVAFTFSCTPDKLENNEQLTDKECNSPPNDRNCNGIPDNEE